MHGRAQLIEKRTRESWHRSMESPGRYWELQVRKKDDVSEEEVEVETVEVWEGRRSRVLQ